MSCVSLNYLALNMCESLITDNNIQKAEDVIKNSVDYIFEKINDR